MKLIKDYPPETQWQTRDGRPVRLLFTDAAGGCSGGRAGQRTGGQQRSPDDVD
jgi:hypothetical protein